MISTAYIALGSNLGNRTETLNLALHQIESLGELTAISSIYETDPVGFEEQPAYLNAVVELATELTPEQLLTGLLDIERQHGRERSFPNAPRTLDLDLLLFDELTIDTAALTVPHPRMHVRAFVLTPLVEIAPGLVLPGLNRSAASFLLELQPSTGVQLHSRFARR